MRHPLVHQFLKWVPTAVGAGSVAIAAVWAGARDWITERAAWGWDMLSDPLIALLLLAAIAAYIWAIIYTGQPAPEKKTGLAALKPMTRRQKKADDELRRKLATASPREAKRLMDAELAKLNAPKRLGPDFPALGKAILDRYSGEAETFAYRKAVLQLSEVKATGTRQAGATGLSSLVCHMDVDNHTKKQFQDCRVRLVAINGDKIDGDVFLRIGGLKGADTKTTFAVRPYHSKARINFMKRDLDDVVSNPPFLLCLNDRDLPVSDGAEYRFVFALECEYEHPTYATVRCFIPERETIEISLEQQGLDPPDE